MPVQRVQVRQKQHSICKGSDQHRKLRHLLRVMIDYPAS